MAAAPGWKKRITPLFAPGLALAAAGLLAATGLLGTLDRAWFDLLQRRLAARAPVPADTAIALVDEQSMQALGREPFNFRWPWPRGAFAAMLAGLHRAGAKAIVVDQIFLEQSASAEQDALLGAVAAGWPEVTLGAVPAEGGSPALLPVFWSDDFRAAHPAAFAARARWGWVRSRPDSDSVIRAYAWPGSLADAGAAAVAQPAIAPRSTPETILLRYRGGLKQLRARGVPVIPVAAFVAAGWPMLDRASEQAPDLDPAALTRALEGESAPEGEIFAAVRGRIVFIGANAQGTFDTVATPVGSPEPGVLTHWTAHASVAAGDFIVPLGRAWVVVLLVAGVAGVAAVDRGGLGLFKPGLVALSAVVLAGAGSAVALPGGWWLPPAVPAAGALAGFVAVAVERFRLERARKREIQGWFGSYVSPAVVKQLLHNPDSLKLGGERRELTVYFSDLAGFTTLSERLPPDRLVSLMNLFLEELTECVLRERCYLDKYIGDAIMAVFGSPEPVGNHALAACRAALASQRRLAELNGRIEREHGLRLGMRIGINTGEMIVGNVGSAKKRNYTVLGDAVNLASRLEGANKEFHTTILLGPATQAALGGALVTRPVALLQVKGKAEAVAVHELVGEPGDLADADRAFLAAYGRGYAAFAARDFAAAEDALAQAAALRPGDFLATRYRTEAARLRLAPPGPDWLPVLKLESK